MISTTQPSRRKPSRSHPQTSSYSTGCAGQILRLIAQLRPKPRASAIRLMVLHSRAPEGGTPPGCQGKIDNSEPKNATPGLDRRRPATKGLALPGSPENRYHSLEVQGSSPGIPGVMSSGSLTRELAKKILPHSAQEFLRTWRKVTTPDPCPGMITAAERSFYSRCA